MFKFTKSDCESMKNKVITILKRNENFYIFCLFLLFFPLKTQLQNIIMYFFDMFFRNGITTEVFTYNYTGTFVGCEKIDLIRKTSLYFNWFQKHGIYYLQFLPSLFAFGILFKRWKKNNVIKLLDWFLVILSCFSVLTALNDTYFLIIHFNKYNTARIFRLLPTIISFLSIALFIFFQIFSFK